MGESTVSQVPINKIRRRWKVISHDYILRKFIRSLFIVWAAITATFVLIHMMPSNPIELYVNQLVMQQGITYEEAKDQAATLFSIDLKKPMSLQYIEFLQKVIKGDFGTSVLSPGTPVADIIKEYLPWTVFSIGTGLLISFTLGILLGMLAAYRRDTVVDQLLTLYASIFSAVPNYLVAIIILVLFGVQWGVMPIAKLRGVLSPGVKPALSWVFVKDALFHGSFPIIVIVLTWTASWLLIMRSSTWSTLEEDYVNVARAKGLTDGRIMTAYVGRNATLPLFARFALAIGLIVGGSVLIEQITQYRGVGYTLLQAVNRRDYSLMQGIFLILTFSVIFANFFADLLYGWIDPRIKVGNNK